MSWSIFTINVHHPNFCQFYPNYPYITALFGGKLNNFLKSLTVVRNVIPCGSRGGNACQNDCEKAFWSDKTSDLILCVTVINGSNSNVNKNRYGCCNALKDTFWYFKSFGLKTFGWIQKIESLLLVYYVIETLSFVIKLYLQSRRSFSKYNYFIQPNAKKMIQNIIFDYIWLIGDVNYLTSITLWAKTPLP